MIIPNSTPLRSVLSACKNQSSLCNPCAAASTSLHVKRHFHGTTLRPKPLPAISQSSLRTQYPSLRTLTQSASPSPSTLQTPPQSPPQTPPLSTNPSTTISSTSSSLATTTAGISYLVRLPFESTSFFGLDPIIVMGLTVVGSGGTGWLLGPFLGEMVFGWRYRQLKAGMAEVRVPFNYSFYSLCV